MDLWSRKRYFVVKNAHHWKAHEARNPMIPFSGSKVKYTSRNSPKQDETNTVWSFLLTTRAFNSEMVVKRGQFLKCWIFTLSLSFLSFLVLLVGVSFVCSLFLRRWSWLSQCCYLYVYLAFVLVHVWGSDCANVCINVGSSIRAYKMAYPLGRFGTLMIACPLSTLFFWEHWTLTFT